MEILDAADCLAITSCISLIICVGPQHTWISIFMHLFLLVSKVFGSFLPFISIFWSFYFCLNLILGLIAMSNLLPLSLSFTFYRKCQIKVGIIWLVVTWSMAIFSHALTLLCDLSLLISFFCSFQRQTWVGIGLQEVLGRIPFIQLGKGRCLPWTMFALLYLVPRLY